MSGSTQYTLYFGVFFGKTIHLISRNGGSSSFVLLRFIWHQLVLSCVKIFAYLHKENIFCTTCPDVLQQPAQRCVVSCFSRSIQLQSWWLVKGIYYMILVRAEEEFLTKERVYYSCQGWREELLRKRRFYQRIGKKMRLEHQHDDQIMGYM
jgi:hypothetical protein